MTFKETLVKLGGYWEYSGGKYLALLASGKVSDVFCNTGVLTTNPHHLENWTCVLVQKIWESMSEAAYYEDGDELPYPLMVVGPGMGGITLAYSVADELDNSGYSTGSRAFFTEPVIEANGEKSQKFRFELPNDSTILLVEDVITTGGSVQKTLSATDRADLDLFSRVACLVDRREVKGDIVLKHQGEDWKCPLVSLLQIQPKTWDTIEDARKDHPDAIEAIRPKQNWEKLVAG